MVLGRSSLVVRCSRNKKGRIPAALVIWANDEQRIANDQQ